MNALVAALLGIKADIDEFDLDLNLDDIGSAKDDLAEIDAGEVDGQHIE